MTDFSGAPLAEVLRHVALWKTETGETISHLRATIDSPQFVADDRDQRLLRDYSEFFIDAFQILLADFDRLATELPCGVSQAHVELVDQMHKFARRREEQCVQGKDAFFDSRLHDIESVRALDHLYSTIRDQLVSYQDLSNVACRLSTFVGLPGSGIGPSLDLLELKPNFFGLGINLNNLVPRLGKWWRHARSKR